ncbi:rhamnulokinase [Prauserella muralis]|uniref:Carbohydrate kinase n=1 Tax=Prauserella muralis TaxID=588067 RepID=A0A2V4B845_9PSEU|nr:rhamnulokinase family protein [Prauserella muralis]PXY31326.1 carbohydrate kinase [Prauserella muralis]TWE14354.1 rhamnulokinase [Prauserella muralis]
MPAFVAVDLGATSGRVMLGDVRGGEITLTEVRRFPTGPRERPGGGLRWDVDEMYGEILAGLRDTADAHPVSIGIDSWAVDYGLIGPDGTLDGDVRCYRDPRTAGMAQRLRESVDDATLYRITGLQYLPFNTIYQLLAEPPDRLVDKTMLLLPDLIGYWLTGEQGAEVTNASTTALLDATTRQWSAELLERTPIPGTLLPPLRLPGTRIGEGPGGTPVVAVASHDTASAVAAVPASGERFGYISCGTWSLVGLELPSPVLTEAAREANFTNEAGIDGTVRFLRNTMGLWLLSESMRVWREQGLDMRLSDVLAQAMAEPAFRSIVDPDSPEFLPPGDMPARIAAACAGSGQPVPQSPPAVARTILESLAVAHAASLRTASRLSGRELEVVHLVGGGALNEPLCQFTADACGLPVLAGPVEASALGNVFVQARAAGVVADAPVAAPLARYEPRGGTAAWESAARRVGLR